MAKNNTSKNQLILYGRHAVLSALKNPNRKKIKLLCTKDVAEELHQYSPQIIERKDLEKMLPTDKRIRKRKNG